MGVFVSSRIYEGLYIPGGFFGGFLNHPTVAPAKDGWKMILSFWGNIQGQLLVLGRVYYLSGSGETMDITRVKPWIALSNQKKVRQIYRFIQYTMLWNTHVYMCTRHANLTKSMYCISWSSIRLLLFIYIYIYWGMSWQNYAQMAFGCIHFWEAWARMSPTNPYKPPLFLNFLTETQISP